MARLATRLAACGWHLDVIAPAGRQGFFTDASLETEPVGADVLRVGLPFSASHAMRSVTGNVRHATSDSLRVQLVGGLLAAAKRVREQIAVPDEMLPWAVLAARRAAQRARRRAYNVLFTTSFPFSSHLAGYAVARRTGLPWVVELRDPWAGHAFRRHHGRLRRRLDFVLEARVLHRASLVVVVSPGMRSAVVERYGTPFADKIVVVPNAYDPGDFGVMPQPPAATAAGTQPRSLEVLYVGSLDADIEPPDPFLRALAAVVRRRPEARERLRFIVLGGADLASSQRIRRWEAALGGPGVVRVVGFAPHVEAIRRMCRADALALSLTAGMPIYTSKVLEYLASGRPILAAVGRSDCRDLLQRAGGAVLAEPSDPTPLVEALCVALDRGRVVVPPLRREVLEPFTLDAVANQLADVLHRAAHGR